VSFIDNSHQLIENNFKICNKQEFCSLDIKGNRNDYIDWSNKYSLHNWITSLDLHCGSSFEIGIFGSLFFLGYLSSCLVFPPLADQYGRKLFVIIVVVE